MKYYRIRCQRGHRGTHRNSEITFVFEAQNLLEAMDKARQMPSVKHQRIPLEAAEITQQEYIAYRTVSAYDRNPQGKKIGERIL